MRNSHKKTVAIATILLTLGALSSIDALASETNATASHDFTKLSHASNRAMTDVVVARSALFDGNPEVATKLINDARVAIHAATADDTAFMKAESELTNPTGTHAAQANVVPVAWLPFGGDAVVQDDWTAQPAKAKAVADANEALKKGKRDDAIKALKLADVNVAYNVDVVPLKQTEDRINQASALLGAGKYYEAGQVLHQVQDSVRIDQLDINTIPKTSQN
jgi:hypothetical protein